MKLLKPITTLLLITLMSACSPSSIDADEEGVLIYKPYIFGSGGVDQDAISTGLTWTAWSTEVQRFKIIPIRYDETFDDVITADNTPVDFDGYVTLQVRKGDSPALLETGGMDWYEHNVAKTFRALLRDNASLHSVDQLSSKAEARDKVKKIVGEALTEHINSRNLPVDVIDVEIGRVVPPEEVLAETDRTAAARQRVKSENELKLAEDSRKLRETSRASADKEYMNQMNMTVDQYLISRSIEIEREKLEIIKGKDNVHVILNSGSGAGPVPMFSVE